MEKAIEKRQFNIKEFAAKYGVIIGLILIMTFFTVMKAKFLTVDNMLNMLRQTSINGFLAIGMTFVVLTGGIDLSVGSIVGASGMFAALVARTETGMPWFLAVLTGLAVGLMLGLLNGIIIAYLKVPAFIATLGMLSIARGVTFMASDAKPVPGLSPQFLKMGGGSIGIIPIPIIVLAAVLVVCYIVLYKTRYGRYVFATGGNPVSARVSGINVKMIICSVYMISGVLAGLAGVILTSRVTSGLAASGEGYEVDAIAAAVIGGNSLAGGRGRLWGTIIGFLIMGAMNNGLDMMAVSSYWQLVIKGIIIIGAVMLDSLNESK
ncbi:MAG: ABC transporter permease [Ruminococcus sp.]|nr:ABC transporter permease [Ruminococcus sp.]